MKEKITRRVSASLVALVALFLILPTARAQEAQDEELRRDRPSRRVTNPVRPRPTPTPPNSQEPRLVSTADESSPPQGDAPRRSTRNPAQRRGSAGAANTEGEREQLQRTVTRLSDQVERLSEDISRMKNDQRMLFDLERLTRAEQRAESLRSQLREVTDKEFQLQDRLAQIDFELEPDSIQRRAALVGTLNPGAVRDQLRASLERERERVQRQLELVANSRVRLESAVANAELEVERLRQRVDRNDEQLTEPEATDGTNATPPAKPDDATPAEPPLWR